MLNDLLQTLVSSSSYELRLEPNKIPYIVSVNGTADASKEPLQGTHISMMVFPLIPQNVKLLLPTSQEIQFVHPHNLGKFAFTVSKSPAGFNVTIRPAGVDPTAGSEKETPVPFGTQGSASFQANTSEPLDLTSDSVPIIEAPSTDGEENAIPQPDVSAFESNGLDDISFESEGFIEPAAEYVPLEVLTPEVPDADRRAYVDRRKQNLMADERMDLLFNQMAIVGASDLHLSVSMPPLIRKDGKMQKLECDELMLSPEVMRELLTSIMPERNRDEFEQRHDTDFAYEIADLARFRCNIFMDRKGMGGVFRIIPTKILTAEQLGLSKAIMDLCTLSKGLVVVTGPTGSGKSTTLCAMVDHINKSREDHIITIEDPIEFVHDNHQCLVNQREVHNHTDSFKDALRAALREDPDIVLVGEMRDLETISIAIETAETGHLVFGTLHTTTAPSTVDRIIDQFPADRQQQIRVMLSESLKGVVAQTLLPKIGGGRVAALEVLIVTPAISNLIREGKTFQIPSAMQTGKNHGMVMLNDALFEHVKKGVVEPRDAYIKAVDKPGFENMLTRGGFKL
ncbi:MAG TPA: type IV pilus twitching motility protein PilT [Pyrinomonadaceae bacterium]|nr:type IV pilus twitching motility protein PilT [Pyrinomonadaceae bacterium]